MSNTALTVENAAGVIGALVGLTVEAGRQNADKEVTVNLNLRKERLRP